MPALASTTETADEPTTIRIYWSGSQLLTDPPTFQILNGFDGQITFQLEQNQDSPVTFYQHGIVFQYPHAPFNEVTSGDYTVTFNDRNASISDCGEFKYAVLIQQDGHVYYFDPTVQNDPPGA